jgi:hypothetical protein
MTSETKSDPIFPALSNGLSSEIYCQTCKAFKLLHLLLSRKWHWENNHTQVYTEPAKDSFGGDMVFILPAVHEDLPQDSQTHLQYAQDCYDIIYQLLVLANCSNNNYIYSCTTCGLSDWSNEYLFVKVRVQVPKLSTWSNKPQNPSQLQVEFRVYKEIKQLSLSLWDCAQPDHHWSDWTLFDFLGDPLKYNGFPEIQSLMIVQNVPSYHRISKMLETCFDTHPECSTSFSEDIRIINLINVKTNSLVGYPVTSEPLVRYVALSYVWGRVDPQRFELGPLNQSLIPKTIRDAMQFVLGLGETYLWADMICIDQFGDKRPQISIMDQIYCHAWATIIWLEGTSANDGLPRLSGVQLPQEMLEIGTTNRKLRFVRNTPELDSILDKTVYARRAWTLQEEVLSRRRLYITKNEIYIDCERLQYHESLLNPKDARRSLPRSESSTNPKTAFVEIAQEYCTREITRDTDRLFAFEGMGNYFSKQFPDTFSQGFHYGIPVEAFIAALLWNSRGSSVFSRKRRITSLPSWSWIGWQWYDDKVIWRTMDKPFDSKGHKLDSYCFDVWTYRSSKIQPILNRKNTLNDSLHRKLYHLVSELKEREKSCTPPAVRLDDASIEVDHMLRIDGIVITLAFHNATAIQEQDVIDKIQHIKFGTNIPFVCVDQFALDNIAIFTDLMPDMWNATTFPENTPLKCLLVKAVSHRIARTVELGLMILEWDTERATASRAGYCILVFGKDDLRKGMRDGHTNEEAADIIKSAVLNFLEASKPEYKRFILI